MSEVIIRVCSISDCSRPHHGKGYCKSHYLRLWRYGDPLGGGTPKGSAFRFIHEVAMLHTSNECLTWPFSKSQGYGMVWVDGRMAVASRYICELVHGAPPTLEHEAAHSCGKGHEGCIAPGHLDWKTKVENAADKLIHGTNIRGECHVGAKLTEAAVREILALKGVEPKGSMAARFGVAPQTISNIHVGRSWAWMAESKAETAEEVA